MVSPLFQFEWRVPSTGFRFVEAQWVSLKAGIRGPEPILTNGLVPGARADFFAYAPLVSATGLFRTFAQLPPDDPTALVEFANEYGSLGGDLRHMIKLSTDSSGEQPMYFGERLADWRHAIGEMRRTVELWDAVKERRIPYLKKVILWDGRVAQYQSHPKAEIAAVARAGEGGQWFVMDQEVVDHFQVGDLVRPGWYALQQIVNERLLRDKTTPRLLWDEGELGLFNCPSSLLGAMWLQLARAISGNKRHDRCVQCGTYFEVAPGVGRDGKKYCSDACRSAAYRARKAKNSTAKKRRSKS